MSGGIGDWEDLKKSVKENVATVVENTKELKKFNQSSTVLSGAMIFIGILSMVLMVLSNLDGLKKGISYIAKLF